MTAADTHRAIEAVWRIESAKLIAGLARIVRDVGLAEDLAQDALVIALEQWPESGLPNNPGAWLMATAKHRAIDRIRRNVALEHKVEVLGREIEIQQETAVATWFVPPSPTPRVILETPVGSSNIDFIMQQGTLVIGWVGPTLFAILFAAFILGTKVFQWLWALATWLFSGTWRGGGEV